MIQTKQAIIFGASGLVGTQLLQELIRDNRYDKITIFLRKRMSTRHLKVKEIIVDLHNMDQIREHFSGEEVFCCLGTTIKKAGSQDAFKKVDYDLPLIVGSIAKQYGIEKFLVISSLGADEKSNNFYLKTKGEMEQSLVRMNFNDLKIFRPSMLLGSRIESRPMETLGKVLMSSLSFLFIGSLKKYKAIQANTVARAMIKAANTTSEKTFFESDEMEQLAK